MKKIPNNVKPALIKKTIRIARKEYKTWQAYLRNYRIINEQIEYYENQTFFWSPIKQKFITGKELKEYL